MVSITDDLLDHHIAKLFPAFFCIIIGVCAPLSKKKTLFFRKRYFRHLGNSDNAGHFHTKRCDYY